jgi:hypothetical protein
MHLFSKCPPDVRPIIEGHINQRWGQLYELEKEWGERALKYLLMTNSGGAIATLSFLGASQVAIQMTGAKVALFLFVLGVVLVGASTAKQFHHMSRLFTGWKADVANYYSDKVTWGHVQEQDKCRAVNDLWDYLFPYGAFLSFIGGCIAGAVSLFAGGKT